MVRREKEKISALVLTLMVMVLALSPVARNSLALYAGCPWYGRLGYPFVHANFIHAFLNCWCFLSVVFHYEISWKHLMAAYAVAISIPSILIGWGAVVGASGVCFALFGMVAFQVRRKLYYQTWILLALLLGFILPGVASWLHVYCYLGGMIVGSLTTPIAMLKGGWNGWS